jgi:hypothetical protein
VVRADHLDVRADRLVAVLGLEVVDRHLDGGHTVLAGQVRVDPGLVVEHGEHDLVAADLLVAPTARAAAAAGGERRHRHDSGRRDRQGAGAAVAHAVLQRGDQVVDGPPKG